MASQDDIDAAGRAAYTRAQSASGRKRPSGKRPSGGSPKTPKKKTKPGKRPGWLKFIRVCALILSFCVVIALCFTAYAGNVSPVLHSSVWGILPLCFSPVALVAVVMLVGQLGWNRPGWITIALGMIICAGPLLCLCPLHLFKPSVPNDSQPLTVLTYNIHNFIFKGHHGEEIASYILDCDADIVCLQEVNHRCWPVNIPTELVKEINKRYPYIMYGGYMQTTLSKYPLKPIHINLNRSTFGGGDIAVYHVEMPDGRIIALFNLHLESYKLSPTDKDVFEEITELKPTRPSTIKHKLIDKLANAARERAAQARQLTRYIRLYGGPNVIVTGDFNDVPCCYTMRMLEHEYGLKDVYAKVGFGPMITFYDNRFYFCIDHIMYRGAMKPISLKKGDVKYSDHYPLLATFALTEQKAVQE